MKLSPTAPLALALVAGLTAAAAAQTTPGSASEPQPTLTKPQAGAMQNQPGENDNNTRPNAQMQTAPMTNSSAAQMNTPQTTPAPAAELNTLPTTAKQRAHFGATHARLPETQATYSPDQVKTAQEQLHAAGLYNGPTDGLMDPDTRAALARFQDQNGLRRTETLNRETLARLNSKETTGSGSSMPPASPATSPPSSPATSPAAPNSNTGATAAPLGAGGNTTGQPQPASRY